MADVQKEQIEFINILLSNKDRAISWAEHGPESKFFDPKYQHILAAVKYAAYQGNVLTKKTFLKFLENNIKDKMQIATQENLFDKATLLFVKNEDYNVLKENIIEYHVNRKAVECIDKWHNDIKNKSNKMHALKRLASSLDELQTLGSGVNTKPVIFESISDYAPRALEILDTKRNSTEEEDEIIKTGISEVDNSIVTGIAPGTLTLFGADVGNYKTTMMLNVALNIWENGHNVLFVPLEMPRELLYWKIMSRQAQVPFDHILKPREFLTQDDWTKITETTTKIKGHNGANFYIMEKLDGHTTVSNIQREIEKRVDVFQPRAVVVDYVGILSPDQHMKNERDDVKIGLMLKSLRASGKPMALTDKGFGIISGAQIGREALKRIRRVGVNKTSFHSEDLRGSHEYSADADNIFAQMKDPSQPNNRLLLFHLKTRYGKPIFSNGESKVSLYVQPNISLIRDLNNSWVTDSQDDILGKVEGDLEDTLNFDDDVDDLGDLEESGEDNVMAKLNEEEMETLEELNNLEIDDFDTI